MSWTVVVPIKAPGRRKLRLAAMLTPAERDRLADAMLDHVVDVLTSVEGVATLLLSPVAPPVAGMAWRSDAGPLNATLDDLRYARIDHGLVVLNADLPLLTTADVTALIAAAEETGLAIAPDRHGGGTNAVAAAAGRPLRFRFGVKSALAFREANRATFAIVERPGLAVDIDTPDDLAAIAGDRRLPQSIVDIVGAARHF